MSNPVGFETSFMMNTDDFRGYKPEEVEVAIVSQFIKSLRMHTGAWRDSGEPTGTFYVNLAYKLAGEEDYSDEQPA